MRGLGLFVLTVVLASEATSGGLAQTVPDTSRSTEPPAVESVRTVRDLLALGEKGLGGQLGATKVTLEVVDTPVAEVLRSLEVMLRQSAALKYPNLPSDRLRFEVAPGVRGSVTMCLHNVSFKTTLAALCESVGCLTALRVDDQLTWVIAPIPAGGLRASPPRPRSARPDLDRQVRVQTSGTALGEFLSQLLQIEGLRLEVTTGIAASHVSIDYEGPLRGALDELCGKANCTWRVDGEVMHFEPR